MPLFFRKFPMRNQEFILFGLTKLTSTLPTGQLLMDFDQIPLTLRIWQWTLIVCAYNSRYFISSFMLGWNVDGSNCRQKSVDRNSGPQTEVKVSCKRGSIVELLSFVVLFFFSSKLSIILFSHFVIQFLYSKKTYEYKIIIL